MKAPDGFELHLDDGLADAGVVVGFLLLDGLENRWSGPAFDVMRDRSLEQIIDTVTLEELERDSHLAGYRELHRRFGLDDASLVPSPESLLRVLLQRRELRSINPIVDIYNVVAITHRLSCGAHDLDRLNGCIRLQRTAGVEPFRPLGGSAERPVAAGEYAYLDGLGRVICRLECKQAEHSAVSSMTRNVAIIVQGNHNTPLSAIDEALSAIEYDIGRFVGVPEYARRTLLPATQTRMGVPAVGEVIA